MGQTQYDKIWNKHVVKSLDNNADILYIDRHYIHEVTSPQAFSALEKHKIKVFRPNKTTATADHNIPTIDQHLPIKNKKSKEQVDTLERNCAEHNIEYFGIGHENNGIVHVIGPELGLSLPGSTIVCGDSHTSTHGAFGAIAFGIGTSQVEQVLASQCLITPRSKTMKIEVSGTLGPAVTAKDLILYIISQLGTEGATGHFIEYCGETISNLSMEERMTICNMSIEMGARGGLVKIDNTTINYLSSRTEVNEKKIKEWMQLNSDQHANFDITYYFDAEVIQPMITCGTAPDTGINIDEKTSNSKHVSQKALDYMQFGNEESLEGNKIDYVFIGSCTNSRIEDLRSAASIIEGKKIADHVTAYIVPGSQKVLAQAKEEGLHEIFSTAGFELRQPGCSACLAMNDDKIPAGALCVSTSNRNFEGRQGKDARTILASPLTAAISAIHGKITDPTEFLN